MQVKRLIGLSWVLGIVLMVGGCGIFGLRSVEGLKQVVGDSLPGAQGMTREDQNKIDFTVARGCAAGIYEPRKCDEHTEASADRRAEFKDQANAND